MTAPPFRRRGFSRLETDVELLVRIRAKEPRATQFLNESVDQLATRYGLTRRIVEDAS